MTYDIIKKASKLTDSVIIGFSGGKDSVVCLDLCIKHFKNVEAYFLYIVKDLGFQERYLGYIEKRYKISFHRLPHWVLSIYLSGSTYRPHTQTSEKCKAIKINDIEDEMRQRTGFEWVITGQKCCDSIDRNAMIKRCGGIDEKTNRIYPLAFWNNAGVFNYLKINRIPLPPDYNLFKASKNASFGGLAGQDLKAVKEKYPEDYKKILDVFPFAEAAVKKYEFANNN